jgi:RNA polymerase sigma-70 factor (ECF subfamily)
MELQQDWNAVRERLHGFILRRISDPHDAEDLLQDVLVKMHGSLRNVKDHSRVQAWAYQITRNAITDYYRQARSSRREMLDDPDTLSAELESRDAERELAVCLEPMIRRLPVHYRDAVVMADLEGTTQREVATRLGISLSGAKSRVQRGREKLREMLHECCMFELDRQGVVVGFRPRCEPDVACEPDTARECS